MLQFALIITLISSLLISCASTQGQDSNSARSEASFVLRTVPQKYSNIHQSLQGDIGQKTLLKNIVKVGGAFEGIDFIDVETGTIIKSMPEYKDCVITSDQNRTICVNEEGWVVFDKNNILIQRGSNPTQNQFPITQCVIARSTPDFIFVNENGSVLLQQFNSCIIAINLKNGAFSYYRQLLSTQRLQPIKNEDGFMAACDMSSSGKSIDFGWCVYEFSSGRIIRSFSSGSTYNDTDYPTFWIASELGTKVVYTRKDENLTGFVLFDFIDKGKKILKLPTSEDLGSVFPTKGGLVGAITPQFSSNLDFVCYSEISGNLAYLNVNTNVKQSLNAVGSCVFGDDHLIVFHSKKYSHNSNVQSYDIYQINAGKIKKIVSKELNKELYSEKLSAVEFENKKILFPDTNEIYDIITGRRSKIDRKIVTSDDFKLHPYGNDKFIIESISYSKIKSLNQWNNIPSSLDIFDKTKISKIKSIRIPEQDTTNLILQSRGFFTFEKFAYLVYDTKEGRNWNDFFSNPHNSTIVIRTNLENNQVDEFEIDGPRVNFCGMISTNSFLSFRYTGTRTDKFSHKNHILVERSIEDGRIIKEYNVNGRCLSGTARFFENKIKIAIFGDYFFEEDKKVVGIILDLRTGKVDASLALPDSRNFRTTFTPRQVILSKDEKSILAFDDAINNEACYWSLSGSLKWCKNIISKRVVLDAIDFDDDYLILSAKGFVDIYGKSPDPVLHLIGLPGGGFLKYTPEGYYSARNLEIPDSIKLNLGLKSYTFDQMDFFANRASKVNRLLKYVFPKSGITDEQITTLQNLERIRAKNNGFDLNPKAFNAPNVKILSNISNSNSSSIALKFEGSIENDSIVGYKIWVNGVPLHGDYIRAEYPITKKKINDRTVSIEETIALGQGSNKIEVSMFGTAGIESPRESITVTYNPPTKRKPDLYFVGIGIDEYNLSTSGGLDALKYAVKDSKELEDTFQKAGKGSFGNVYSKVITNKEVTQGSIKTLRDFLAKSQVDDHVILFLSGHGIRKDTQVSDLLIAFGDNIPEHYKLRNKSDVDDVYYYMTSEANVDKPWEKGIPLDSIRNLVNGIPSRQKIMFVDTCQSGEKLDLDDKTVASLTKNVEIRKTRGLTAQTRGVKLVTTPGANTKPEEVEKHVLQTIAKSNLQKEMSELFPELRRGTGTIEISAATGAQSALESSEWKNGAFTYVIKEAILKGKAKDKSGNITARSLRKYILDEVENLTDGQQTPMVARDIAGRDFVIFGK